MFYLICAAIVLAVLAALSRPLLRTAAPAAQPQSDLAFYRAQLRELERDLARGTLAADEAERTRAEIARRLLAADKAAPAPAQTAPAGGARLTVAGIMAAVGLGAVGLYALLGANGMEDLPHAARLAQAQQIRETRPSQAEAALDIAPPAPRMTISAEMETMIGQLRAAMQTRPDALEGHEMLASYEAELGNFDAAIAAQQNVIRIKGANVTNTDRMLLLDLMVFRLRGYVSPEAEAIARAILNTEPGHVGGRYYIGLLLDQTARPDIAFSIWRELIESGSSDPHVRMAARSIEDTAARAGIRYTLPEGTGPDQAQIAAAAEMTPEARQQMIRDMVEQLNARLATEGGPAGDWARLITSLAMLGESDRAAAILDEAETRFAGRAVDSAVIADAARQAGLR